MVYARQTTNQPSIMASLVLTALMALWYLKALLLNYLPAAFFGSLAANGPLFWHGLVAGILVTMAIFTNRWLLKSMKITLSRKWFSRRRYRRAMKILFLGSLYVVLFWMDQYLFFLWSPYPQGAFVNWYAFHLLFFIVAIPWLAHQKSSLHTGTIVLGMVLTIAYPTIVVYENLQILDGWIDGEPPGNLFLFHYLASVLFLIFLGVVLRYGQRSFKGKTWAKRFFLIYAVIMFLIVIIAEMVFTLMAVKGFSSGNLTEVQNQLFRLPVSVIIAAVGVFLLAWGFLRGKRFIRTLALILILLAAGKLIYYDLSRISLLNRVLLLFVFGTVLVGISVFYSKMYSVTRKKPGRRSSRSSKGRSPGTHALSKPGFQKYVADPDPEADHPEKNPG